jgi:homoserine O-acetyltransferase
MLDAWVPSFASIHASSTSSIERGIKRVPCGRAIVIPMSDKTRGHGSHTLAALWKNQLADLLKETEK